MKKLILKNLGLSTGNRLSAEEKKELLGGAPPTPWWVGGQEFPDGPPNDVLTCLCTDGTYAVMRPNMNPPCPYWCVGA